MLTAIPVTQARADVPVSIADDVSASAWNAYVHSHADGTVDHLFEWRDIIASVFGHDCTYLAAVRNATVVGVLPLVRFRSRLFGRFVVSLPFLNYGGLLASDDAAANALLTRAKEVARGFGATHLELRHVDRHCADLPFRSHKLALTRTLPGTTDALWAGLDKKVRNQVRKAQKEGLVAVEGGAELVGEFYQVFAENMRDLGTPVYPQRLFSEVVTRFRNEARVFVVRHNGQPVAASLVMRWRDVVLVPWASSLKRYRHLCPNMLLYWSMMESAVGFGARQFDFGRSSPGSGTHAFKVQWGATERPFHWEYALLSMDAPPDQGPTNAKFALFINVWQRLPLALANAIGPHLIRNIP
jgi:serine/alanine adding enzyme